MTELEEAQAWWDELPIDEWTRISGYHNPSYANEWFALRPAEEKIIIWKDNTEEV